ncbi:MAG: glycosyltransferase [Burkholderiales bacterium]|nr:glycosyltransferase [Burkholderiales bacterium]
MANDLVQRGFAVDMVLMRHEGELLPLLDERVQVVGLGTARVRSVLPALTRYLRNRQPSAVLANMWPLTALAVLAASCARAKCRLVLVEHIFWTRFAPSQGLLSRLMAGPSMRWLFPRATARVAVSDGAARDLEAFAKLAPGSVVSIGNPVTGLPPSLAAIAPADIAPEWLLGDHRRLIAVGSFKEQKRFDRLLAAFASLAAHDGARLLILGEGSERSMLEREAERLGVADRVFMPGFVLDPRPFLAAADLFVLSSDFEGLPTVLIEALEQGCPVVSTDCPSGPREILANGRFGALVPVGDVEALTKSMEEALCSEHDREALKLRAADFSVARATDAYLDLLVPGWRQARLHQSQHDVHPEAAGAHSTDG